jgi:hypothetical protein
MVSNVRRFVEYVDNSMKMLCSSPLRCLPPAGSGNVSGSERGSERTGLCRGGLWDGLDRFAALSYRRDGAQVWCADRGEHVGMDWAPVEFASAAGCSAAAADPMISAANFTPEVGSFARGEAPRGATRVLGDGFSQPSMGDFAGSTVIEGTRRALVQCCRDQAGCIRDVKIGVTVQRRHPGNRPNR